MKRLTWFLVLALGLLVALSQAMAQEADADSDVASEDELILDEALDEPEFFEFDSPSEIEDILSEEWRVLAGETKPAYDPGNRRDPFRSLLTDRSAPRGPRPEGVPGLLIGELEVTGIMAFGAQKVAQVRATDRTVSYLVREGDRLYDGDVVSIGADEVVFQQVVDDPAALRPFRTVVKDLRPEN